MTGVTDQLTGAGPEIVSYVEVHELMVVAYFGEPAITPDGDGGVDIHRERMVEGRPYPLTVDEVTLIAGQRAGWFDYAPWLSERR